MKSSDDKRRLRDYIHRNELWSGSWGSGWGVTCSGKQAEPDPLHFCCFYSQSLLIWVTLRLYLLCSYTGHFLFIRGTRRFLYLYLTIKLTLTWLDFFYLHRTTGAHISFYLKTRWSWNQTIWWIRTINDLIVYLTQWFTTGLWPQGPWEHESCKIFFIMFFVFLLFLMFVVHFWTSLWTCWTIRNQVYSVTITTVQQRIMGIVVSQKNCFV